MLASLVAATLVLLGALHVYWGLGGRWPGRDEASLAGLVVGTRGPMPGLVPCLVVAALLTTAAVLVLVEGGALTLPIPPQLTTIGAWGVVIVFALRGVGGLFEVWLRPSIVGLPYARWSRMLYSPLCLVLAALTAVELVS